MLIRRLSSVAALSLVLLAPQLVGAAEAERVVVTKRLYSTSGRFEMSMLGGASFSELMDWVRVLVAFDLVLVTLGALLFGPLTSE